MGEGGNADRGRVARDRIRSAPRALLAALGLTIALSSAALGVLTADPPVRLSSMGPDGAATFWARFPAVAYNPDRDQYLLVWHGEGTTDEEFEIYGRLLDATGAPAGAQFQISRIGTDGDPLSDAFEAAVSYNAEAKEYLVVWRGDVNPAPGAPLGALADNEYEVYGQRLADTGKEIGADDFRISDMGAADGDSNFDAFEPAVAYDSASNQYLVVWRGDDDAAPLVNDEYEIFGQRLSATGADLGANDFRISHMGPDGSVLFASERPAVAYNSKQDEYLVAWRGDDDNALGGDEENEVFVHRLGIGVAATDVRVSDMGADGDPNLDAFEADLAYNATADEYLVVWRGDDDLPPLLNGEFEVFGQRLSSSATELGQNDFRISSMGPNGDTTYGGFEPAVAWDRHADDYVVAWWGNDGASPLAANEVEIFAHAIGADGTVATSDDVRLSGTGPDGDAAFGAFRPALAFGPAGGEFIAAWEADGPPLADDEFEIFSRRFRDLPVQQPVGEAAAPSSAVTPAIKKPTTRPRRRDRRAPGVSIRIRSPQHVLRQGGVLVLARCDERCRVAAIGRIRLAGRKASVGLRRAQRTVARGRTARLKLKLRRSARKSVAAALSRNPRLTAELLVAAVDRAGNRRVTRRHIELSRGATRVTRPRPRHLP
jgi:hypothetical protein